MLDCLNLPPELRLNVYHHLLITSIADGRAADVGALLFTCRIVYGEMRADYIPAVTKSLQAITTWQSIYSKAPLKIDLPHDYDSRQVPAEATINFPKIPKEGKGIYAYTYAITGLQPFISEPWRSLTFSVYTPRTSRRRFVRWKRFQSTFDLILPVIAYTTPLGNTTQRAHSFSGIKSLILCLKTSMSPNVAKQVSQIYGSRLKGMLPPSMVKQHEILVTQEDVQRRKTCTLRFHLDLEIHVSRLPQSLVQVKQQ
jgi:hypothetical protein